MAMENYEGPGTVILDGSLLAEAQSVRVSVMSNARPVVTMRKGLAGRSRGPVETSIDVSEAVPRAGTEQDFIGKCVADATVRIVAVFAGKRYQWEGWIDQVGTEQSAEASASLSFTVKCGPPVTL